ncbi:biosynthetic-type acetolactate synthase large subunit [Anaeromicropila populeti]|uniref:Acetolactate synthase n=1 Tax=Anaeromicropila populeti TaxID=37658 RepID=A0A1I6JT28_9FIRM|nr:biosynthetic-type acetolactate synthase large subunit [Anaeromicropila populeti]SFR82071.1 acetolactate synthase, large subunit [Anaeromicropila populeti]
MLLSGSQILIECLKEQGVDTIFGYPGGSVLNIYDELYQHPEIRHILTSHEQGASHAADGYARSTGRVGVCLATSGPGATNLVTGIATAYMDSVPMVAITGNVPTPLLGKDSFQEVDIAGITMPITKHSFIVKDIEKLADTIRRAFEIAQEGRPGPVLVDITKDVTAAKTDYERTAPKLISRVTNTITEHDIETAVKMIGKAKKPMIFVGGGAVISNAEQELREFVEKVDAPVTDTLMGKGAFSGDSEYYTGMLGMHGTKTANLSVTECDLLIVVGARFSDRVTGNASKFAKKAKILQIDIDRAEINKNIVVDHCVVGDVKAVLDILNRKIEKQYHKEWIEHVMAKKDAMPVKYPKDRLTGQFVIEKIYELTGGDAIITTEVGQHQMWASQFYKYKKPRTFLTSGGLGTMGYGLGASIGAKVANPDKMVFNIAGDGCFRMNMNEIATAVRYQIPIIQVVCNNGVLGMVRQWQTLFYGKRYSHTVLEDKVDFVKLAEAMGAKAYRITTMEETEAVLKEAMALNEPVVIDCMIHCDDKVWPMVAPGAAIEEVFSEEDLESKK